MLKILTDHNQQESTMEEWKLSTLLKFIAVGKFLSFMVSLFKISAEVSM
jgi:hypothetical protein